jgi:protein involved in polysaccharide export with SLBB domain
MLKEMMPDRGDRTVRRSTYCFVIALAILWPLVFGCAPGKMATKEGAAPPPVEFPELAGFPTSGQYRGLAIADLDNDGHLDVIGGAVSPGGVTIWYGNGSEGISEVKTIPFKGDVQSVVVQDVNGDGLPDVVGSVQQEASGLGLLVNLGERRWKTSRGPTDIGIYQGLDGADINHDGYPDVIAANRTSIQSGGIQVWLGDGKGNWPLESGPSSTGEFMDAAVADFDGDGNLDIAGAGWGMRGVLTVWFGDGAGAWTPGMELHKGSMYGISATDLNGDGIPDLIVGTHRNGILVFRGSGRRQFKQVDGPVGDGSYWRVAAADLDGDGRFDLVGTSLESKGIQAWKNLPTGGWSPIKAILPETGIFYEVAIADLNGDGREDLCATSFGEGVKGWLGRGGFPLPALKRDVAQAGTKKDFEISEQLEENGVFTTKDGFPEYRVDSGDVIEITFWRGTVGEKEDVQVKPDGKISFGYIEDLYVRGLTLTQLDRLLTRNLQEFIKHPRIDVVVKEYNSKFVTFLGAVGNRTGTGPGRYKLKGKIRLLAMLSEAGGPRENANLSDVRVTRKNNQSFSVNLYKAMTQGDMSQDIVLDDGDIVYLDIISKESNRVYVFGEVDKPGVYTYSGSDLRIFDAVSKAGGYTVFGKPDYTKVVRGDITNPEIFSANLRRLVEEGDQSQNMLLANGDLVYVPRNAFGDINRFYKRVLPFMRLIIFPAQLVNEYNSAGQSLGFIEK